ncbi:MAG: sensor histidine kinase [Salinivirgaceae bacterium]|jgi:nitrogen-specific signal transduction histidine kinase|nr:HAMP domain-containing histidine kinase [Bacteroidales bacterium]
MDKYNKKRRLRMSILLFAFLISLLSLLYTNLIVDKLKIEERKKMELYALALKKFAEYDNLDADMSLVTEIITNNTTVPLILTTDTDSILAFVNFNPKKSEDTKYMESELEKIKLTQEPIIISLANNEEQRVYYKDSTVLTILSWYPFVQLFMFALFILVGYIAFSNSRKAEQNSVWIGMSKETAHQLGTPISSLLAWVEILKNYPEIDSYMSEIQKDINRLDVIARRFSKIGSSPDLTLEPIAEVIKSAIEYMQYRTPENVNFNYNSSPNSEVSIMMNRSLFEWVIENLIRNSVDAMQGKGNINFDLSVTGKKLYLDISDTGKGIHKRYYKTIFSPGYTSKERGWGLGLSLAKRIIENYHKGKLFVKTSELNKGTTMRIVLNIQQTLN